MYTNIELMNKYIVPFTKEVTLINSNNLTFLLELSMT